MARPRETEDTELLRAAMEVFAQHGPQASTALIAKRAGVSQATLFKRFGNKRDLLIEAILNHLPLRWLDHIAAGPDERPLAEQLVQIGELVLEGQARLVPCLVTFRSSGIDPAELLRRFDEPPPLKAQRLMAAWFAKARQRQTLPGVDDEHLAQMFLGALHSEAFLSHLAQREIDVERSRPYLLDLVHLVTGGDREEST